MGAVRDLVRQRRVVAVRVDSSLVVVGAEREHAAQRGGGEAVANGEVDRDARVVGGHEDDPQVGAHEERDHEHDEVSDDSDHDRGE